MYRFLIPTFAFSLFLVCVTAFKISHHYQDSYKEHKMLLSAIHKSSENIHMPKAEWSYLNNPKHLACLSKKYLPKLSQAPYQLTAASSIKQIALIEAPDQAILSSSLIQTAQKQ